MELTKGTIIRQTKSNSNPLFKDTIANGVLTYEVTKVNKKTYGLKCIDGYMKGSGCKLLKDFSPKRIDEYGTLTEWEIIA